MRIIVGITGASGSVYGVRLTEELLKEGHEVFLVISDNGKKVLEYEMEINFEDWFNSLSNLGKIELRHIDDMFSSIASGSFKIDGMVIAPCSMGTASKISLGISDNLLIRAADVTLKEKRKLIIIPRETPLNTIHLRNLTTLSELNAIIMPPVPAFYSKPKTLDDIINITIGRVLMSLGIDNNLFQQWG